MRGPSPALRRPPSGTAWRLYKIVIPRGTALFRLNRAGYPDPANYGRACRWRFDSPDGSYGVCYLGMTLDVCFLEVLRIRHDAASGRAVLLERDLDKYDAFLAVTKEPLTLAWLAGSGLGLMDVDLRVTSGNNYLASRAWSFAIHAHQDGVDGIYYTSRYSDECHDIALFERAATKLEWQLLGRLSDRSSIRLWAETTRILDELQVDVQQSVGRGRP